MPDEFGGVEISDEFGGIAVEEEQPLDDRPPRGETPADFVEPPRFAISPAEREALQSYQPPSLTAETRTPQEIESLSAPFRAQLEAKQRRDWQLESEAAQLAKEQSTDTIGKTLLAAPINVAAGLKGTGAQLGGVMSGAGRLSGIDFIKEQGDLLREKWGGMAEEDRRDVEGLGQGAAGKAVGRLEETLAGSLPAIPAAIIGGLPAAAVVAGGQSFGGTYNEAAAAYEKTGLSKDDAESQAMLPATISGISTALITAAGGKTGVEALAKLGGKQALDALGAKNLKDIAVSVLKNFRAESFEEGGDQFAQAVIQKVSFNPKLTFGEAVSQVTEAAVMGGIMGGGAGGIVSTVERFGNRPPPSPPPGISQPPARAPIPAPVVAAIAKADAIGLTRSAQAAADVVKQSAAERAAAAVRGLKTEEPVSDQPQKLETPIEKGIQDAEAIRSDQGQVRAEGRQPEVVQNVSGQDLQQPAPKPAEPVGAQGGAEAKVPLTPEAPKYPDLAADVAREAVITERLAAIETEKGRFDAMNDPEFKTLKNEMAGLRTKYDMTLPSKVVVEQAAAPLPEPVGVKQTVGEEPSAPAVAQAVPPASPAARAAAAVRGVTVEPPKPVAEAPVSSSTAAAGSAVPPPATTGATAQKMPEQSKEGWVGPLYHGNTQRFGRVSSTELGVHFGDADAAMNRLEQTGQKSGEVKSYWVKIKNPVELRYDPGEWMPHQVVEALPKDVRAELEASYEYDYKDISNLELKELLKKQGYDGIRYPNAFEGGESFVAFENSQFSKYTSPPPAATGATAPSQPAVGKEQGKSTPPAPAAEAAKPARDWDLFNEDLVDNLDSFSPARDTGKRNYVMADLAQRFVEYAKADKTGRSPSELIADFAKQDEASVSHIRKLKESVLAMESKAEAAPTPAPPAAPVAPKPEAAAAAAALRAAPKSKPLGPRAGGQRFNDLLAEWGEKLGWTDRGDLIAGIVKERTGLSGASVLGTIAGKSELSKARRAALIELGINPDFVNLSQLRDALPKLEQRIAEWQLAEDARVSTPLEQMPQGSEFTIHGKKWRVEGTNPDSEMTTLRGPGAKKIEVDMSGDQRIDPGSLKSAAEPFEMIEGTAPPVAKAPKPAPEAAAPVIPKGTGMKMVQIRPGTWKYSHEGRHVIAMRDGEQMSVRLFNGDTATAVNALVENEAAAQVWAKQQLYGKPAAPEGPLYQQNLRDKTGILREWIQRRRAAQEKGASQQNRDWAQVYDKFEAEYKNRPFTETLEEFAAKYLEDYGGEQLAKHFNPAELEKIKSLLLKQSNVQIRYSPDAKAAMDRPLSRELSRTLANVSEAIKIPQRVTGNAPAKPITKGQSILLHLRDKSSRSLNSIRLKSTGDLITDARSLREALYKAATDDPRISLRESSARALAKDGSVTHEFFDTGYGMTWATPEALAEIRPPEAPKVAKLKPEEGAGTGDLLKNVQEPMKLAAETGVDVDKAIADKAAAETAKKEAALLQAKQQMELPGTNTEAAKKLADKIRDQFKTDTGGQLFTGPVEVINAAVELVARTIEAGGKVADAIAKGVEYIRARYDGPFDEAAFTKQIRDGVTKGINPEAADMPGRIRSQVFGEPGIGHEYTPESVSNARAWVKLEVFDGDRPVSEAATAEANKLLDDWINPSTSRATGDSIMRSTDTVLGYGETQIQLLHYALKLAAEGKTEMVERLIKRANEMAMPGIDTMSEAGRALRGRTDFQNPLWATYVEAFKEREGIVDKVFGGKKAVDETRKAVDDAKVSDADKADIGKSVEGEGKPDKEIQRAQSEADSILDKYAKSQSDTLSWRRKNWNTVREVFKGLMNGDVTEAEFRASLEGSKIEGGTIDSLVGVANRELEIIRQNTIAENRQALRDRTQELWKQELERNQTAAENMLHTLEQQNAGAEWVKPSNRTRVREIAKAAMKDTEPVLDNAEPWVAELKQQFLDSGVDAATADALARNIEQARRKAWVNARERQNSRAANSPNVTALIDAIEGSPLSSRTDPAWRKDAEIDFFLRRGLSREQANRAQAKFDAELSQRWAEARVKAAERSLHALPEWQRIEKSNPTRARSNLARIQHAIRAELTNPGVDWETILAKDNGWKGFSKEQHVRMAELDTILADPMTDPHQRVRASNEMMDIARNVKMPPTRFAAIAEGYAASMFSGLPTLNVNIFAPPLLMIRNLFTELATNPAGVGRAFSAFGEAMKTFKPEFQWSWLNDSYAMHTSEYLKQSGALKNMMEEGIADIKAGRGAKGAAKVVYGAQQFVFRTLSSLDQAWRTVERQYKTELFSSKALKSAGYTKPEITRLVEGVVALKRLAYEDAIARGMTERDAQVRSHDAVINAWWDGISEKIDATTAREIEGAAQRESDMVAGLKSENLKEMDEGMASKPLNKFMEYFSHGLVDANPFVRLGTRMMFGVVNVPFRALRYGSNFSPYGLVRYAVHKARESTGRETYWKQSFGNERQTRQRLAEAVAGSALMAILPMISTATSEDDDKKQFALFVTGKGPDSSDKIVRDAWLKKYRPYSIIVKSGDKYGYLPLGRIGESVMWSFALQGALDDYALKQKHNAGVRKPKELEKSVELAGSYLQTMSQRGIFSTFQRLGEIGSSRSGQPLPKAVGAAAYSAGPLIPYKGMMDTATRLFSDPIDRSKVSGAIIANVPIAGGVTGKPAINALGDPIDDRTFFGKVVREGLPVAIKQADAASPAYDLIMQFGQGPTTPSRTTTETMYGPLTNEQWYQYSLQSGKAVKKFMEDKAAELGKLDPVTFNNTLSEVSMGQRRIVANLMGLKPRAVPARK